MRHEKLNPYKVGFWRPIIVMCIDLSISGFCLVMGLRIILSSVVAYFVYVISGHTLTTPNFDYFEHKTIKFIDKRFNKTYIMSVIGSCYNVFIIWYCICVYASLPISCHVLNTLVYYCHILLLCMFI